MEIALCIFGTFVVTFIATIILYGISVKDQLRVIIKLINQAQDFKDKDRFNIALGLLIYMLPTKEWGEYIRSDVSTKDKLD